MEIDTCDNIKMNVQQIFSEKQISLFTLSISLLHRIHQLLPMSLMSLRNILYIHRSFFT